MIMENLSEWFDRLQREHEDRLRKEFEEFSLPKKEN